MFKFNNNKDILTKNEVLAREINDFNSSDKKKWMITGLKYYLGDNDIKNRSFYTYSGSCKKVDLDRTNNKLSHSFYKNQVDEKVNYILGKPYTITGEDLKSVDIVNASLGEFFLDILSELAYEATNKGIAWLQVYINEQGELNFCVIPSEEVIPIWKDGNKKELECLLRSYNKIEYVGRERKIINKVELWDEEKVTYYIKRGDNLILDSEAYLNKSGEFGHFLENGQDKSWGRVPFIPFRNNNLEVPDIKFIKNLIDQYDIARSEAANYVEDVNNLIYVLKGYGGEDLEEFMRDLKRYRAVKIDYAEEGDVSTISSNANITALSEHYMQLKRDIIEVGQGVNKNIDNLSTAPSGIALKFLFSSLDLKCNALENSFKKGFREILYFIEQYNSLVLDKVDIVFNRDIVINEKEAIDECKNSLGIISNKTIIANHPWVVNLNDEIENIKIEREEEEKGLKDFVPLEGVENE